MLVAAKSAPAMNDSDLLAATRKVFKANVNDPSATIDTLKVSNGRRKVELTVSAVANNMFMGFAGLGQQSIGAFAASVTADNNYEIALVIDNSGSMASSAGGASKMQSAKDAANKLIDAMMGAQQAANKTKFSVVPFTLAVNVGSSYAYASWMDTAGMSSIHWQNLDKANSDWKPASRFAIFAELGIGWAGCVETRPGAWALTDGSPALATPDSLFVPMFAPDEPGDAGDTSYQPDGSTWWSYANSYLNDNPKKECKDVKSTPNEYAEAQTKLCKYQSQSSLTTSGGRGPNARRRRASRSSSGTTSSRKARAHATTRAPRAGSYGPGCGQVAHGVGAVERVVQRTPPRVGRVDGVAGVRRRHDELRSREGGDLGVHVRRVDLERLAGSAPGSRSTRGTSGRRRDRGGSAGCGSGATRRSLPAADHARPAASRWRGAQRPHQLGQPVPELRRR